MRWNQGADEDIACRALLDLAFLRGAHQCERPPRWPSRDKIPLLPHDCLPLSKALQCSQLPYHQCINFGVVQIGGGAQVFSKRPEEEQWECSFPSLALWPLPNPS